MCNACQACPAMTMRPHVTDGRSLDLWQSALVLKSQWPKSVLSMSHRAALVGIHLADRKCGGKHQQVAVLISADCGSPLALTRATQPLEVENENSSDAEP